MIKNFADFKFAFRQHRLITDEDVRGVYRARVQCPQCGASKRQLIVSANPYQMQQYAHCEHCKYTDALRAFISSGWQK